MAYSPKLNWVNNDIVKPEDLNRIERGIFNSADITLSNVQGADFLQKANQSGVATGPLSDVQIYVSPQGDDAGGNGSSQRPFLTIEKAINTFPTPNDRSVLYTLNLEPGMYAGFTLNASKNINIVASGEVRITSDIDVNFGSIAISSSRTGAATLIFQNSHLVVKGGKFQCSIPITFTNYSGARTPAIECLEGSTVNIENEVSIQNIYMGVSCIGSTIRIKKIATEALTTGISCSCGIVQLGEETISATTKFVIQHGARIYVGAQTSMPNY